MQYPLRYQADYLFSCSMEAGRWLFGEKAVKGKCHYVLKNAIDANVYRYDAGEREKYRSEIAVDGKFVCVHVGRFCAAKNHGFLLEVFQKVCQLYNDAVLILVGDGELRGEIERKIQNLGIQDVVMLLGNRYDIPKILQAADMFLFPSEWEGLGIAAVEAQAAGLPCICSDRVPNLVKVTEDCRFLPLEADVWIREIQRTAGNRRDTYERIVKAGFDVHATADWLAKFYEKKSTE